MYNAVITGDIVNSRQYADEDDWLHALKGALIKYGEEGDVWEVYRGDSFQVHLKDPSKSFQLAVQLRAVIRAVSSDLDVRMGIGIGEVKERIRGVKESTGAAFINSGEQFERLKKERVTLSIKTPWHDFDEVFNVIFKLSSVIIEEWSPASAEIVSYSWKKETTQIEIANTLGKTQSTVSRAQARANLTALEGVEDIFSKRIQEYGRV